MQSLARLYAKRKSSITDIESRKKELWKMECKRLLEYCFKQLSLQLGHSHYYTIVSQYWLVQCYRKINPFGVGLCYGTPWHLEIEAHLLEVLIKTKKTMGKLHNRSISHSLTYSSTLSFR